MHIVIIKSLFEKPILHQNEITNEPIRHNFNLVVNIHLFEKHYFCVQLDDGLLLGDHLFYFFICLTDEDWYAVALEDEDLVPMREAVHDVLKWSGDVGILKMQLGISAVLFWDFNYYNVLVRVLDGAFDELRVFLFLVEIDVSGGTDGVLEGAVNVQNLMALA
jgi:hypothetical protein